MQFSVGAVYEGMNRRERGTPRLVQGGEFRAAADSFTPSICGDSHGLPRRCHCHIRSDRRILSTPRPAHDGGICMAGNLAARRAPASAPSTPAGSAEKHLKGGRVRLSAMVTEMNSDADAYLMLWQPPRK